MKKIKLLAGALLLATSVQASEYSFEFYSGFVYNMKEDILIRQGAADDIAIDNANLKTNPTTNPLYYGMRITKWDGDESAWEFEHLHQKLYIENPEKINPNLTRWEITDGYNFFFINKAKKINTLGGLVYRYGGGLVITHPDVTIYEKTNHKQGNGAITAGEGYHLSGFVVQTSIQKEFPINKKWYFKTELRATYAQANVPIADGDMNVRNRALHFNYGVGYKF
ncbi:MAG: hypothetical protein U9N59_05405 [Campylobacterota bacterium]|nr:hypothetical protein [Campylobacterota bacterium]